MSFQVKRYTIKSNKLSQNQKIAAVFLSDLHLTEHGVSNCELIDEIVKLQPDFVIVGGDMVIGNEKYTTMVAENLLQSLSKNFPVYCALGNHEMRLKLKQERYGDVYPKYEKFLLKQGVYVLDNEHINIRVKEEDLSIYGLSLPLKYYKRFTKEQISKEEISEYIGKADTERFNILLAHHPRYAQGYFTWGADLILSGHIHGGVMRIGNKACISPDFQLFPKYGYGSFVNENSHLLISGGLGEHTIPFRVFNPKELVYIEIIQEVSHGDSR